MTFRRTPSGLSNLHAFVGVDLVVFTEGGDRTISKPDAVNGEFSRSAIDIVFWRQLFTWARNDLKVDFRALGSKNALKEIANDILEKKVTRICVAMDRDYDGHFGQIMKSTNILYTRGYSWENDLYKAHIIEECFYSMTLVDGNSCDVSGCVRKIITQANRDLRWLVYVDALLCIASSSLFDRQKYESCVLRGGSGVPHIKREWLLKRAKEKRRGVAKFRLCQKRMKLTPQKDCYGKILLSLLYGIFSYLIKKHTNIPSLPKHYAVMLFIKAFINWLIQHPRSSEARYYHTRISNVSL